MKDWLLTSWAHLRGWRTSRKIVVFESDDWGAIRIPGRNAQNALRKAGLNIDQSAYNRLDCLERQADFQALMDVLDKHRDGRGRAPIFTLNTVMGNPDFESIRNNDFREFYHQHFFDSYRDYHDEDLESQWREAIEGELIRPQFHGREHLNVPMWMRDLREGVAETRIAFQQRFYGLTTTTSSRRQVNYLAAYWTESANELESARSRLEEGLGMFRDTFGFDSKTFIACNYVFPTELETTLVDRGVRLLQGQRGQILPNPMDGSVTTRRTFIGQQTPAGLTCTIRNVQFEPYRDEAVDWALRSLKQIAHAFAFGKPAIITSHRINYTSGLSIVHRDRCLRLLDSLLEGIMSRWPDVCFLSSDEMLNEMVPNALYQTR